MSSDDPYYCAECKQVRTRRQISMGPCACGGTRFLLCADYDAGSREIERVIKSAKSNRNVGQGRGH